MNSSRNNFIFFIAGVTVANFGHRYNRTPNASELIYKIDETLLLLKQQPLHPKEYKLLDEIQAWDHAIFRGMRKNDLP